MAEDSGINIYKRKLGLLQLVLYKKIGDIEDGKKMEEVIICTNNGLIEVSQPNHIDTNDFPVIIHPDQIDLLVKWLQEARDELCKNGL